MELPVLIGVGSEPVSCIVVPFVGKPHRDSRVVMAPGFFDKPLVKLPAPFPRKKLHNLLAAGDTLSAISPSAIDCINEGDLLWITGVPAVFSLSHFLSGSFASEGWYQT